MFNITAPYIISYAFIFGLYDIDDTVFIKCFEHSTKVNNLKYSYDTEALHNRDISLLKKFI